jgi:GntR family transcriptional repressor for pyruvate dehydrogenase complex
MTAREPDPGSRDPRGGSDASPGTRSSSTLGFVELDRGESLSERVANRLLETIVSAQLGPGDRLPSERLLADQFAVSRTVIREAVRSLAGQGIIEARPGRGLTVTAVKASAVRQSLSLFVQGNDSIDYPKVHEVRALLEVQVAGLAARRVTDGEIEQLRDVCDRMEAVLDDNEAASRYDVEFHRMLAAITRNELYELLLDAVADPLLKIRRETFTLPGRAGVALAAHRLILGCVEARDVSAARRQMGAHLRDVERTWERFVAKSDGADTASSSRRRSVPVEELSR